MDKGGKHGDGKKWSYSEYNSKVCLKELVDGLVRGMIERLENLEDEGDIDWNDQECGVSRVGG